MKRKVYAVHYRPVFAEAFQYTRVFTNKAKAKEYIKLESSSILRYCGKYNLDNNFKIEEIEL